MITTMGMKKIPVILCMLLFSTLDVLAQQNNRVGPAECCFNYYPHRLPKNNVVKYQRTNIHCARNDVVFTMKNGGKFCVNPTEKWVQSVIAVVESRPMNPTSQM